jgi:hypothetical protein
VELGNIYHGPKQHKESRITMSIPIPRNKRNISSLSVWCQYPFRRNKRDRIASMVLMLHQGNSLYKRRWNRFTTIILQKLRIQEQGLNRKLQDLCRQDWGFPHLAFVIYYQATTRRTLKNNITILLDKLDFCKW